MQRFTKALDEVRKAEARVAPLPKNLRWVREATPLQGAKWRITGFINYATAPIGERVLLEPVRKALEMLSEQADRIANRWRSTYTNARLEGLNGLFQAALARARG